MSAPNYPRYRELPLISATGDRHAWGCFGDGDELGTMNFIGPEQIRGALQCASEGRVINLDLPLDLPDPPLAASRHAFKHHVERTRGGGDDHIDGLYLQGSTQWDGIAHVRYREFGYYGGREEADLDRGELGIDRLARKGMIGRGVLVDFAGWRDSIGQPVNGADRVPITSADLEAVLGWSGCEVRQGDILLVRTGWLRWYLALDDAARQATARTLHNREGGMDCPGLAPGSATAAWLWDRRIAAVAADNPALEVLRVRKEEGFLHRPLIPLLGMPIGEFWNLEELAQACRERGRHDFFLTSSPLNLPRGVGSPANAYAVL